MPSIQNRLSASFVLERCAPNDSEIQFGVRHGFIAEPEATMLAVALGREDIEYGEPITRDKLDSEAVEMYCRVRDLEASGEWTDHPARLWMFLALDWLYLHRDRPATELAPGKTARDFGVEDNYPLGVVAMVWADFWYPSEISDLVHYMPVEKGVEVGEAALLDRWSEYLLRVSAEFSNR